MAVDAAGNVYVADYSNSAVKEILAAGGGINTIGSGFLYPAGVAVDAAGDVFVVDEGYNKVSKIPTGNGTPIAVGSGFLNPQGVAVDFSGTVYVCDDSHNAIKKIVPLGGYYISALPAGLSFNNSTGVFSGTPTAASPATNYTATAYNYGGGTAATVNIKVVASANDNLSALTVSRGALSPAFSSATTSYTASVVNGVTSMTVTPTAASSEATIKVNGVAVTSGSRVTKPSACSWR